MSSLESVWSCVQHCLRVHTTALGSSPALVDSIKELGSFSNVVGGFRKQRVFIVEVLLSSNREECTRTLHMYLYYIFNLFMGRCGQVELCHQTNWEGREDSETPVFSYLRLVGISS